MADAPAPTEDQVKAANEAELARWEGDFKEEDLVIPYKREESDADKKDDEAASDDAEPVDAADDDDEEYSEPTGTLLADPGEYQPADYSFEVTLADGKSVKITNPAQAEQIADDAENFATPKQLLDFMRKSQRMERKLEQDHEQWQASKQAYTTQAQELQARNETINNFAAEFDYLVNKSKLPAVDAKYKNADWSDPEVAKQPGVREQLAVINYMVKENKIRAKANVKPLTSVVDAYNAWKEDSAGKQDAQDTVAAKEARKAAGSRVAGVSTPGQTPFVPKGIAVGNPNVFRRNQAIWDN